MGLWRCFATPEGRSASEIIRVMTGWRRHRFLCLRHFGRSQRDARVAYINGNVRATRGPKMRWINAIHSPILRQNCEILKAAIAGPSAIISKLTLYEALRI